ncbi:MAG TPA: PQQ-binding-like beta-propeller repeat protein, partial [Terracidiphilus sp.]
MTRIPSLSALAAFMLASAGFAGAVPAAVTHWDYVNGRHEGLLWRAQLGTQVGPVTVAGDRVLVGTNNERLPIDTRRVDESILMCLSASTGKVLWSASHARLASRTNDLPVAPIASQPCVDGDRVCYVSNRGELCCVALNDGHRIWTLDMVKDLNVFKRDPSDIA